MSMPAPIGAVRPNGYRYLRAPMLVYWELTRACPLACRHCRALAIPDRSPTELSTQEGLRLLDRITEFGTPYPHLIFTGGDPLRRPDLVELVRAATARGIGSSLAPSARPDLTPDRIHELKVAGTQVISLSLDGSTDLRHDEFRGVPGTYVETLRAARDVRAAGIPLQINTLVTRDTVGDLPAIYALLRGFDIMRWSLFFLIGVGRGADLREVTAPQAERLIGWLLDLGREAPFAIKTTEALHHHRIAIRRLERAGSDAATISRMPLARSFGIRDGNGILFVAHDGAVYPSGFLPLSAGNVRDTPIADLYRHGRLFVQLRDVSGLKGKCGRCQYNEICGGSRARAYASTGDPLESDPLCAFVPPATIPA